MKYATRTLSLLLILALTLTGSLFASSADSAGSADIVDTAVAAGSFTTLVKAVQAAGLVDTLKGEGPFTVFAPTDEAFAALPAGTLEALLADKEKLAAVLTYHVVAGKVMAADVVKLSEATTVQGGKVSVDSSNGVRINNAKAVKADIETSNGVIHVIDTSTRRNEPFFASRSSRECRTQRSPVTARCLWAP